MLYYYISKLQETCDNYGGISHPSLSTCCASACGNLCGADNCDDGPGGAEACCGGSIPSEHICGISGRMAPCHLGNYNSFTFLILSC